MHKASLWLTAEFELFRLGFHPTNLFEQSSQEWFNVGHNRHRLKGAAIRQLDNRRRIDIDTDNLHPGGKQVADGHGMQHRREHEAERHIANPFTHLSLSDDGVRNHIRQRTIVTNASGQ